MSDIFELRARKPSLLMRLLTWFVSKQPKVFPDDPAELRHLLATRPAPEDAPMPDKFNTRFQVERWQCEGHECVTLHPRSGKGEGHILYFHGGGFILPILEVHWPLIAALIDTTGASVSVPLYPVVPEADHSAAEAMADALFAKISQDWSPETITLMGDSAGGNLAAALALRLAEAGGPQAGKLVLFAPWLDVTLSDEAARGIEPHDIMLRVDALRVMGEKWAGARDPRDALVSPLYASQQQFLQLPPTAIFQGQHDLFVVDCRTYAKRAAEAGKPVRLYEYAGAPHVFMALLPTREAKDCLRLVAEFMRG
ncbi:alpha/beta hydrolase [Altererythrobacter arenosus]|uniref:Alpha/beta hydrolase n=1 Tax=Altererythrobacter arenosus TaxID=3032592 RepID=A0ABY8FQA1_9SPHN|nr:alpha/beta hydrolase [Altererythrobacter sp. CAU 1644]WFL76083.1 alpha/beta hydrolase [Altererythrobacter sp. CAU 1644]